MSDYEEYGDDDFDDFHDMLYDADPAPDLADDLAEHAAYSPVWQDNPTEELREYFSDWTYYSDDYFDDDPNILNNKAKNEKDRKVPLKPQRKPQPQPRTRGRKRKLSQANESPDLELREVDALRACLRGTVWKGGSPEPLRELKFGTEEPVALRLSDKVMRAAYSKKQGFGRGRLTRDESWANDLSLADMGLKSERSISMHNKLDVEDQEEYEEADEDDVEAGEDEEVEIDEEAVMMEGMVSEQYRVEVQSELAPNENKTVQEEVDEQQKTRKRRKLDVVDSQNNQRALPTPDASLESEVSESSQDVSGTCTVQQPTYKRRRRPPKYDANNTTKQTELAEPAGTTTGRKRKLSPSESRLTASTASSRAKRVATSNGSSDIKATRDTAAAGRPTRSRKK
ncbi:hypothetical protein LTR64_007184 [Lithohypha guttulata]|uniref:uncharacterized protein n=1 Tax=Lithohypha guttulata TaxID=1690604 RepID=UPI002DDF2590|nr:hypothetical protein LTR51_004260 [Lithohypha guttulata]